MLIVMRTDVGANDIQRVIERVESLGLVGHILPGKTRTAIAVTGNDNSIDPAKFETLPGVAKTIRVTNPYKLASRNGSNERRVIAVGSASIGASELALIAGPCAVESPDQTFAAAEAVASVGGKFFRGGAFKPRTSPYAFQGMGVDGLAILNEVKQRFGLNIVTEAMDESGADEVAKVADCIQIGARNMQNFSLLKHVGRIDKPILLKRGLSATLEELLLAAEYIMSEGNPNVILCERGIRTFGNHARNTLDLSIVPALKRVSNLPVIVDPSHGTGHNYMVAPLAQAAVAVGSDGLIIEIHPNPENALCDGAQALTLAEYSQLVKQIDLIYNATVGSESVAT